MTSDPTFQNIKKHTRFGSCAAASFQFTDQGIEGLELIRAAARIQPLQRMLEVAAVHGLQIIVLTCAPGDYSAFGAGEIRLTPM